VPILRKWEESEADTGCAVLLAYLRKPEPRVRPDDPFADTRVYFRPLSGSGDVDNAADDFLTVSQSDRAASQRRMNRVRCEAQRWPVNCTSPLHDTDTSSTGCLGTPRRRIRRHGSRASQHGRSHWAAATTARLPCPAAARARLRVGRRLLLPSRIALQVARCLLDATTVCRRVLAGPVPLSWEVRRRPLGRLSRQGGSRSSMGSRRRAG
jgi:hypothetical protein